MILKAAKRRATALAGRFNQMRFTLERTYDTVHYKFKQDPCHPPRGLSVAAGYQI